MNEVEILEAIKSKLQVFFEDNEIIANIQLFPDDVDVADEDTLYILLDIDTRRLHRITTSTLATTYEIRIGLAKQADNYASFIADVSPVAQSIAELLINDMLTVTASIEDYSYDRTNAVGYCAITINVGVAE